MIYRKLLLYTRKNIYFTQKKPLHEKKSTFCNIEYFLYLSLVSFWKDRPTSIVREEMDLNNVGGNTLERERGTTAKKTQNFDITFYLLFRRPCQKCYLL